jgi:hypothetical protein
MTLQTFPNAIRDIGKQIAGLDHTIRVYREELRNLEASIAKDVLAHKAEFPNELARSSEITLRLEAATPEIRAKLLRAEFDRAVALAELEAVRAEFAIWQLEYRQEIANIQPADDIERLRSSFEGGEL